MNEDLKIIKKKFGEDMMHLCRKLFPTILEKGNNELSTILLQSFYPNKSLCQDIISNNLITEFRKRCFTKVSGISKTGIIY